MLPDNSVEYISSLSYTDWESKLDDLIHVADELQSKSTASRRLRYSEIDIEGERKAGRIAPDELYIPLHTIDANIRREQPSYIQYVTQSNRAVCLTNLDNPTTDSSILEHDATNRLRFDGWQLPLYSCIDGFQQDGYNLLEVIYDDTKSGHVAYERCPIGDFGFINDTKNIQECEAVIRKYYFTKTDLRAKAKMGVFDQRQVDLLLEAESSNTSSVADSVMDKKDKSLWLIYKVMFRHEGVVHVAWCQKERCNDWLKAPVPLFLGRKKITGLPPIGSTVPQSEDVYETKYPYILFQYLISENDTISQLKGRIFLDQDVQEAASSLLSSYCTAHRRASGLYFSKDTDDPNADLELQKNVFFRVGALINAKIKQFQLEAPEADMLSAIQALITQNMQETSQVNFAVNNRQDSRKTATEVNASTQAASVLTTVQVVLFSTALRQLYELMFEIIQSRVNAGLIPVNPTVAPFYKLKWIVKPSGDTDVIERQQLVSQMMSAWPVMQSTPANVAFLSDLISRMFPETSQKYIQIFQQAQAAQQQQQQSVQGQMMQYAIQLAQSVVELSKHPEMFSDVGKQQALPTIKLEANRIEQFQQQQQQAQSQQRNGQ